MCTEIWLLTSILQCTTPRRPYVIDGTSHAIQLELLPNKIRKNATEPGPQIKGTGVLTHLTSIASTSPMRSYSIPDGQSVTWDPSQGADQKLPPLRTLCLCTASTKPPLPVSSSPSTRKSRSTQSLRARNKSAAAQATARIGPLSSATPRAYRYPLRAVNLKGSLSHPSGGAEITS